MPGFNVVFDGDIDAASAGETVIRYESASVPVFSRRSVTRPSVARSGPRSAASYAALNTPAERAAPAPIPDGPPASRPAPRGAPAVGPVSAGVPDAAVSAPAVLGPDPPEQAATQPAA